MAGREQSDFLVLHTCPNCGQKFNPRPLRRARGRWRTYCSKACRREAEKNREYLRRVAGLAPRRPDAKLLHRERNRAIVNAVKAAPCSECGGTFPPEAMDLHHRDRRSKVATIAQLVQRGAGLRRLQAEIAKCDLICANCHRTMHFG